MAIMKLGTIPTSPQHRPQPRLHQRGRLSHIWIILSSLIVGGLAGWCSVILTQLYPQWLPDEASSKVVFIKGDQENSTAQIADIIRAKAAATVVTFYPADTINFDEAVPLGRGVLLSADGWIVTLQATLGQATSVAVLLHDGRVFVSNRFVSDSYNATTYLKINGSDLPIVNFAAIPSMIGEFAIWYTPATTTNPTVNFGRITNNALSAATTFSTNHNTIVYLSDYDSASTMIGAPVFNQTGEIIGLNLLDHHILPVDSITVGMYQVLATGKITHQVDQFDYKPLYWTVSSDTTKQTGVRVTAVHSTTTTIKVGDIITALNDVTLDEHHDLSAMLNTLTGPTADVTLQRNGIPTTTTINIMQTAL